MARTAPSITPDNTTSDAAPKRKSLGGYGSALMLPFMLLVAWAFALSGSGAPGALAHESAALSDLRWILYFAGIVFLISSVMHSVFRKSMAASIGWTSATHAF